MEKAAGVLIIEALPAHLSTRICLPGDVGTQTTLVPGRPWHPDGGLVWAAGSWGPVSSISCRA